MKLPNLHIATIAYAVWLLMLPAGGVYAQNGECSSPSFAFDFDGNDANCTITCGKVINESIWKVGGDTCINTSDTIWLDQSQCSGPANVTEVNITMDREGNQVTNDDFVIVDIYCSGALLSTDTTWGLWPPSSGNSNVRTNTYNVGCSYPDFLIIEVIIGSHEQNAKLKQMSGNSCMNCFEETLLPIVLTNEQLRATQQDVTFSFDVALEDINKELAEADIELQRSPDGKTFERVQNFRKSVSGKRVHLTDTDPSSEYRYYRTKVGMKGEHTRFTSVLHWDPQEYESIKLHPNPAESGKFINIESPNAIKEVKIMDLTGKVLLSKPVHDSPTSLNIPLNEVMEAGVYIVTVRTESNTKSMRFIAH